MKSALIGQLQVVTARPKITGPRVGHIVSMSNDGRAMVDFADSPMGPQVARHGLSVSPDRLERCASEGLAVLLLFENNDPALPVIADILAQPLKKDGQAEDVAFPAHAANADSNTFSNQPATSLNAMMGRILGVEQGFVLVDWDGNEGGPIRAKTAIALRNLKDPVLVLSLANADAVVIGQLYAEVPINPEGDENAEVLLKGSRVVIEAKTEVVIKSGTCTVTLDARGKVTTVADQIVSRARSANKVLGGSIQLN